MWIARLTVFIPRRFRFWRDFSSISSMLCTALLWPKPKPSFRGLLFELVNYRRTLLVAEHWRLAVVFKTGSISNKVGSSVWVRVCRVFHIEYVYNRFFRTNGIHRCRGCWCWCEYWGIGGSVRGITTFSYRRWWLLTLLASFKPVAITVTRMLSAKLSSVQLPQIISVSAPAAS